MIQPRKRGSGKWWDTKRELWKYAWNLNGSLAGVLNPQRQGVWIKFTYDALGRRLSKVTSHRTEWIWNGNVTLHEWIIDKRYEDNGWKTYEEDLKTWLFEEDSFVPMALLLDGHTYSIITNHLGTPTEMYDENGDEVWYRRLDMNGKILKEEFRRQTSYLISVNMPFLFQGQYYDYETGLAYNRFRYYDPELGSYISQDPIGLMGGVCNLYAYIKDSNTFIDIWGLKGTYAFVIDEKNKIAYVGKGSWNRFRKSVRHRLAEFHQRKYDKKSMKIHQWAANDYSDDRLGFMVEHAVMNKLKKEYGYSLLNRIASPGDNLLKLSTQQKNIVDRLANELIDQLMNSTNIPIKK